ncbi:Amino acid ABC transporter substrate-binding protein, PAAT family [Pseudomonas sp. 8BK]|uniref:substrate-binding periplasmic protein n=1 Tax=Pseudomonas sp. 8BK TaxID=2653164 RepID=UPI0012F39DB9|nr:transporter substrate-binding domain-containing protein [Pseudomonas sp. 8BK]VXB54738.1 Amino acid ABC transporter substrate-binding protein, PAAT family [Pseudomonas sp. 8BK]
MWRMMASGVLALLGQPCLAAPPVQICLGDSNEWPPYTYWQRTDGEVDRNRLTGAASTLVLEILQRLQLPYEVHYMPWARVQQELADFAEKGRCELTWDASYNAERAAYAHYSARLYETRLGLFYSAQRFAEVPLPALLQNLQPYRVCGVIGYNYQPFGLGEPIKRFPSIQQNLDMLQRQRCDFFPSEIEPLYGGLALGIYQGHEQLRHVPLVATKAFFLLVSKGSPRGESLVRQFDRQLEQLQASGEAQQIFQRFTPDGLR